jgi:chromosome segregation ATPase
MKNNLKFTLLAIGIIVIFFIMGREIIETRAKLKNIQILIAQQKKEKIWIQDELRTTRENLADTSRKLRTCQDKLYFVKKKISALRGRNTELIMAKKGLERRIDDLRGEKRVIEAKFRSLRDLKKAIREVKLEIREERIRQQKEADKWETASGNHGFFTKDGEYFYKPKVTVDVRPANLSKDTK